VTANHKVSVGWQIAFTFISILNLWAFYRIRKLQKYLAYVFLPSAVVSMATYYYIDGLWVESPYDFAFLSYPILTLTILIGLAFQALAVCLAVKWSREHNMIFDQSNQFQKP